MKSSASDEAILALVVQAANEPATDDAELLAASWPAVGNGPDAAQLTADLVTVDKLGGFAGLESLLQNATGIDAAAVLSGDGSAHDVQARWRCACMCQTHNMRTLTHTPPPLCTGCASRGSAVCVFVRNAGRAAGGS